MLKVKAHQRLEGFVPFPLLFVQGNHFADAAAKGAMSALVPDVRARAHVEVLFGFWFSTVGPRTQEK